jgi:hypothetical protein
MVNGTVRSRRYLPLFFDLIAVVIDNEPTKSPNYSGNPLGYSPTSIFSVLTLQFPQKEALFAHLSHGLLTHGMVNLQVNSVQ